ncbi:hypothetical protein GCM10010978_13870 [Compostibacillus humi]|uniref:Gluconate permease n=1 Tax=Compostibacillus humi TaxID=1245525 RepID=A0A8J2ZST5_9BACI|nr:hypothetical protein [Compostibacillus humi]GGH74734.1 hypothetical protein GCM10010978_13870 [Compostibacillus humi]
MPRLLKNLDRPLPPLMKQPKEFTDEEMPNFGISLLVPLIPAIMITSATIINLFIEEGSSVYNVVNFFGSAEVSLLIAVIIGIFVFGLRVGRNMTQVMDTFSDAIKGIAMIIFIVGAGGAFKEIILEAGVGDYIATLMQNSSWNPLIMAWLITVLIRIATGTGVVSAITAAGIVGPLIPTFDVNPVLMVLATAAGSNTITHVNDASFWLLKSTLTYQLKILLKLGGMCQVFLDVVFIMLFPALYFCTLFSATALSLAGLDVFVTF